MLTLADVLEALTKARPKMTDTVITEAAIDSRQVIPGSLFVAIPGERVDGHDFVADAFQRGASFALIQREIGGSFRTVDLRRVASPESLDSLDSLDSPLCLLVENSLAALQTIARFWRRKLDLRVVGITGSVGKSTTKELIAEVLGQRYRTLKSPGNLNNEIGLPLTILRLGSGYERAVLEMGFYVPGEIAFLCDLALPQIGVVTNVGTVHAERAGSQETIAHGKSELVQALPAAPEGVAVLNYDDPWVRPMAAKTKARVFFYGLDPAADLWADEVEGLGLEGIRFRLHTRNETLHLRVPMIGQHSVHTALRAAAVGLVDGLTWPEIISGLQAGHTQLRLVAVRTESGALMLDDTYNASPESMLAALNLLAELDGNKVAVLGDMLELGPYEQAGHEMVGVRAAEVADRLVTVGARGRMIAAAARRTGMRSDRVTESENADEAIAHLRKSLTGKDVVLVKGSHGVRMDRIAAALEAPA
ncbi:MAG: UDP-N-acetylmuramoyl-tripeptide--D-alanyl-D-alanine ligase [Anaerolineaceae bacterium]|nr:MAG: UDP-N-acetylmuramoyl-tripeptide--D-alanyl-D-alanine ligase [Anaerolineaceae bacterium]